VVPEDHVLVVFHILTDIYAAIPKQTAPLSVTSGAVV
jgi:hypothetical protein